MMRMGFTTVVMVSSHASQLIQFYSELGWDVQADTIGEADFEYWNIPVDATQMVRLSAPLADSDILIICVSEDVPLLRPLDAPLISPGGIFDINMRTKNAEYAYQFLEDHGWRPIMEPVPWTFGTSSVKEFLAIQDDGIVLAVMERISPPLEGPDFDRMSDIFNSTQVVEDINRSASFYDQIGFSQFVDFRGPMPGEGGKVLELQNYPESQSEVCLAIAHPEQKMEGSIELISTPNIVMPATEPTDFGRGLLALRIPSYDIEALYNLVHNADPTIKIIAQLNTRKIGGRIEAGFSVISPDNARLDFYQLKQGE